MKRTASPLLQVALVFAAIRCGSESDLQTRQQEGAGNAQQTQPAQEHRANHSEQKPGDKDEHGAPSTKTLVQWQLQPQSRKHSPPAYNLSVALTVAGTRTSVEAGTADGACSVQETHGELGRMRCAHAGAGSDFIIQKEGAGLVVYRKPFVEPKPGKPRQEEKASQVAKIALAANTKVEFVADVLSE